jgi:hypothetical protein
MKVLLRVGMADRINLLAIGLLAEERRRNFNQMDWFVTLIAAMPEVGARQQLAMRRSRTIRLNDEGARIGVRSCGSLRLRR